MTDLILIFAKSLPPVVPEKLLSMLRFLRRQACPLPLFETKLVLRMLFAYFEMKFAEPQTEKHKTANVTPLYH